MATNDVRPEDDGRTHVNVYSRGRTSLGRDLSNFAHLPFELDGLAFASVEGFWFWLVTGVDDPQQKKRQILPPSHRGRMGIRRKRR